MVSETNTFSHPDTPPTTPSPTTQEGKNPPTDPESQIRELKRQSSEALSDRVLETMSSITNLLTGMEEQEGFQLIDDEYRMESEEKEESIILECESLSDISRELDILSVSSILDLDTGDVQMFPEELILEPAQSGGDRENVEKPDNNEDEITEETTGTTSLEVTGCETCEELSAESLISDPEPLILITPETMVTVHSAPTLEQNPYPGEETSKTPYDFSTEELLSSSLTDKTEEGADPGFMIGHSSDENKSLGTIDITVDAGHIIAVQGMDLSNDSLELTTSQSLEPEPSDEFPLSNVETKDIPEAKEIPSDEFPLSNVETKDIPEAKETPSKESYPGILEEETQEDEEEDEPGKRAEILAELGRVFVREETTQPSPQQAEDYEPNQLDDIQERNSGDEDDVPSSITVTSLRVEDQLNPDIEETSGLKDKVENNLVDTSTDSLLTPDEVDSNPENVESSRKVPEVDIDFSLSNPGENTVADGTKGSTNDDINDHSDSILTPDEMDSSPEVVKNSKKVPNFNIDLSLSNSSPTDSTFDETKDQPSQGASEMPAEGITEHEQITRSSSVSSTSSSSSDDSRKIKLKRRGTGSYVSSAKSKETIVEQPIETEKDVADVPEKGVTEPISDAPLSTVNTPNIFFDQMDDKAELEVKVPLSNMELEFNLESAQESNDIQGDSIVNLVEVGDIVPNRDDLLSFDSELEQGEVVLRRISVSSSSSSSSDSDHDDEKDNCTERKHIPVVTSVIVSDAASIIPVQDFDLDKVEQDNQDLVSFQAASEEPVEEVFTNQENSQIGGQIIPTICLNDDFQFEEQSEKGLSDADLPIGDTEMAEQTTSFAPELTFNEVKEASSNTDPSSELDHNVSSIDDPITPPQAVLRRDRAESTSSSSSDSSSESHSEYIVEHSITIAEMESDDSSICSESDLQDSMQRCNTMKRTLSVDYYVKDNDETVEADLETVTPELTVGIEETEKDAAFKDSFEDYSPSPDDLHIPLSVILSSNSSRKSSSSSSTSSSYVIPEIQSPTSLTKQDVDESFAASITESNDKDIGIRSAEPIQDIDVKAFVDSQIEQAIARTLKLDDDPELNADDGKETSQRIIMTNSSFNMLSDVPDVQMIPITETKIVSRKSSASSSGDESKIPDLHLGTTGFDLTQDKAVSLKQFPESITEESVLKQLESSIELETSAQLESSSDSSLSLKTSDGSEEKPTDYDDDNKLRHFSFVSMDVLAEPLDFNKGTSQLNILCSSSSSDETPGPDVDGKNELKLVEISVPAETEKHENDINEVTEEIKQVERSVRNLNIDLMSANQDEENQCDTSVDISPETPLLDLKLSLENDISQPSIASSCSDGDGKTDLTEVTELVEAEKLGYEDEAEIDVPQAVTVSAESPTIDKITLVNTLEESPPIDKMALANHADESPTIDKMVSVNTPDESPMIDYVTMINTPDLIETDSDSESLSEEEGFCESDAMQSILDQMTGSTISVTENEVEDELRSLSSSSSRSTVAGTVDFADGDTPEPPSETTGESRNTSAEPTEDSRVPSVELTDDMRTPSVEPTEIDEEATPEPPTFCPEPPTLSLETPNIDLPSYSVISEDVGVRELDNRTMNVPESSRQDTMTQDSANEITLDAPHTIASNGHSEETPGSQTLNESSLGTYDLGSTMNTDPNLTFNSKDKLFLKTNWPKYDPVIGKSFAIACKVRLHGFELRDQDIKNNASIRLHKDQDLLSIQPKFINGYFVFKIKNPTLAESGWYNFTVNMLDYEASEGQDINIVLKGNKNKRTKSMNSIGSLGSLGSLFSVNNKNPNKR